MGHYDFTIVACRRINLIVENSSGKRESSLTVNKSTKKTKDIKQTKVLKALNKAFEYNFENWDKDKNKYEKARVFRAKPCGAYDKICEKFGFPWEVKKAKENLLQREEALKQAFKETSQTRMQEEKRRTLFLPSEKTGISDQTCKELMAFIFGKFIGSGGKGEGFSFAQVARDRHLGRMLKDWKFITGKCKNVFPSMVLISICEDGTEPEIGVVCNGKQLSCINFWEYWDEFEPGLK